MRVNISTSYVLKCDKLFTVFLCSSLLGLSPVTSNPFSILTQFFSPGLFLLWQFYVHFIPYSFFILWFLNMKYKNKYRWVRKKRQQQEREQLPSWWNSGSLIKLLKINSKKEWNSESFFRNNVYCQELFDCNHI